MKLKLVEDAKDWWKWFSTHAMLLAASIQGAWIYIPDDLRSVVPSWIVHIITISLLILGIVGRVIEQPKKDKLDAN